MDDVRVRSHVRRHVLRGMSRARRSTVRRGTLWAIIDDVVAGRRSGYTWTRDWRFDVNEPASMERTYDKLLGITMYVVAITNRKLDDLWETRWHISSSEGVGLWRDETGMVYADDIVLLLFEPGVEGRNFALKHAKRHGQRYVLKVDGRARSFEFLEVPRR